MTPEDFGECRASLEKMRAAANRFYGMAILTGNHAFIEFTGLMNEYIALCQGALAQGVDFRSTNTHSGHALPAEGHHMAYLAEKLECIYGPTLQDEHLKQMFLARLFPEDARE